MRIGSQDYKRYKKQKKQNKLEEEQAKISSPRSMFFTIVSVLKSEAADDNLVCKEHPNYNDKCQKCLKTRKSRRQRIEDKILYANQLYGMGMREYIQNLKRKRK